MATTARIIGSDGTAFVDAERGGGSGGPGGAEDDSELELGGGRFQSQRSAKGMIRPVESSVSIKVSSHLLALVEMSGTIAGDQVSCLTEGEG